MPVRSPTEVASSLADVLNEQAHDPKAGLYRGCVVALQWVTGQHGAGPISVDRAMTATDVNMHAELDAAIDVLYGRRPVVGAVTKDYASGVEMTLAWVLGESDDPPP